LRKLKLANAVEVVIADTVGFISDLPHKLVAAFRATLEETINANVLLHIIDANSAHRLEQMAQVDLVLKEIGADDIPIIEVFNKIDLMPHLAPQVKQDEISKNWQVWLSAQNGSGFELLNEVLSQILVPKLFSGKVQLKPHLSKLRAQLFAANAVISEEFNQTGDFVLELRLASNKLQQLLKLHNLVLEQILI